MSRHALLIGVGRYLYGYPDLTATAGTDLALISDALKEAGVAEQRRVGDMGTPVSYADLHAEIAAFLRAADTDTDLLVYYTGHGHSSDGITYLVPSDARPPDPHDPLRYLVPVTFRADLRESRARSVSFIIDACRTTPDGTGPGVHESSSRQAQVGTVGSCVAAPGTRTTIVYAASAGEAAKVLRGPGTASLFTRALATLIAKAGDEVPLVDLKRRLQEATSTLAATGGVDQVPAIDVALGQDVDERRAFAFFAAGPTVASGARWSGLLLPGAGGVAAHDFGLSPDTPELTGLLRVLDQAEAAVPRLDGEAPHATFAEPTLIDRLARTARLVLKRVKGQLSGPELLLVIGAVASLEAAVRTREIGDARRAGQETYVRLAMISPQLADAYPALPEHTKRLLAAWCDHVLALRVTIGGATGTLRANLASAIAAALGEGTVVPPGELARDLVDRLHEQFLGREGDRSGGHGRREVTLPEPGRVAVLVDFRQVAALTRLIWLLAADTRLLAPELGLGLVQDELEGNLRVTEALAPLAGLAWVNLGDVLDLALRVRSAPLDQALRRLTADITAFLAAATQPDAPLRALAIPHAATATRLAALDNAFRLPHIQFELSAAETYQLLMGTNLYGDARLAIRELYQNAVDACHYRRWRTARTNPEALAGWHPEIVFTKGTDAGGAYLECRDNGVGMSPYELRESFAKVGRRFRDLPEFLDETTSWGSGEAEGFRPISQFGIGVLSYFMLAERVVIKTVRSDPSGRLGDPLEVGVSSAAGLFRLSGQPAVNPPNGGTIVRLYLRPEFADLNLADTLSQIIAAPTVETTLRLGSAASPHDPHWAAGGLYLNGQRKPAFAAPDLGVYFHEGDGRVLVNGIPLIAFADSDNPGHRYRLGRPSAPAVPSGVTVSLDRRSRPQLSVDRRRLLSSDLPALQALIVSAAARVSYWPDPSVRWLLELFATLPAAGSAAFHRLRGRDLIAWQPGNAYDPPVGPAIVSEPPVFTSAMGITVYDVEVLDAVTSGRSHMAAGHSDLRVPSRSRQQSAIRRERSRLLSSRKDRTPRNGFPVFDDRLIRLLTVQRLGTLPTVIVGRSPILNRGMPANSLGDLCEAAAELQVSVGAAALYRWAAEFADQPGRLALTRLGSGVGLPRAQNPALRLAAGPLGREAIVTHLPGQRTGTIPVLTGGTIDPQNIDDYLAVFQLSAADQDVIRSFTRLAPQAATVIRLALVNVVDVSNAARQLSQLLVALKDHVVGADIDALSARLSELAVDKERDDRVAAYEAISEKSPALGDAIREIALSRSVKQQQELLSLIAVLKDTALTVETQNFISRFLSLYPVPEDMTDSTDAGGRPRQRLAGFYLFSTAVELARSVDFSIRGPVYPRGSVIKPLPLALAAYEQDMTCEELRDQLASAGYGWVTPPDWNQVEDAAERVHRFVEGDDYVEEDDYTDFFDAEGRFIVARDLGTFAGRVGSSPSRFRALVGMLSEAGLAADLSKVIAGIDLPPFGLLGEHAEVLKGNFPLTADVVTLARMTALEEGTFGGALATLRGYHPLIEPCWNLPDELPPGIADRTLSAGERALLVDTHLDNDQSRDWAELLVQASVISGLSLREIVEDALPLLTATGVPTDDLRRLSTACPHAITFDDLLILGCLQTWPNFSQEEMKTITRPFCRFPDELTDRVTHWMENASAWTDRSQRRLGRPDTDMGGRQARAGLATG